MEEILIGGRVTPGVVRIGNTVRRPCAAHSPFVHRVLGHLRLAGLELAPAYLGQDSADREILSFLPGAVPKDLGVFRDAQCVRAVQIIRRLHDALSTFPGLEAGQTICHNDLSPCNFVFADLQGLPCGVIDWDSAAPGDPLDDLAYAAWMWLDIGNDEQNAAQVRRRIRLFADAYGLPEARRAHLLRAMLSQMRRVAASVFPTPEQTAATRDWALGCAQWAERHLADPWQSFPYSDF